MLFSTMILGWIGIVIFLIIVFTFQKMAKNNEYAFLHILMAVMYSLWLPLPIALYTLLQSDLLLVGTIFGTVFLVLLVTTMALQTGHIRFITKYHKEQPIADEVGHYMMATLSNPFESLLGVFKSIWALFLGITFWQVSETYFALAMFLFSLFIFYYLFITLDASLVKRVKLFTKLRPNPMIVNVESLLFFFILMLYVTLNV